VKNEKRWFFVLKTNYCKKTIVYIITKTDIIHYSFLIINYKSMAVVLGIAMFMGLVLIHELGHFIAAKRS